nr:SBBP repeat-containing protein [Bacteroidota bacterium]
MTKHFFIGIIFCLLAPLTFCGEVPKIIFEENKNQWPEQVIFKADIPGGALFLEKNTFTFHYVEQIDHHTHGDKINSDRVHHHAFKVNFENSNPDVEVLGNNLLQGHRNYYIGNDSRKWAENVKLYGEAYYKNLYNNIDVKVYDNEENLKYDIIVHPGGNPADIRLNYQGTDGIRFENGHLFIKTSVQELIEQKPYTYQLINGKQLEVPSVYRLEGNLVRFAIGSYDPSLPLIIDPTRIASTYTGAVAYNWGFTATYDNAGNIYIGGKTDASGGAYPTTVGAWDVSSNGGNYDITLTKFNPLGTAILFSTYYGGSGEEQPHSLVVSKNNELFVVGRTNSANFPVTTGVVQSIKNTGYDIIVGKFGSTGNLIASTFLGGNGDDCVNFNATDGYVNATYGNLKYNYGDDGRSEIILDNNSNVYVAACTKSTNFPISASAYDATIGGTQDGVVFKMNSTLTALTFSTYLGGSADDAAYGLKLDKNNNVFIAGGTSSTNFPTTAGVINPTYKGGLADGFIAVLNSTGTSLLRASYLGTNAYDQGYFMEIDANGDLYVLGQTRGTYPVTAGVYTNANSGQFIHKVNGALTSTIFSTVIGTGGNAVNISPTAFLVDSCQSVYLAGWGRANYTDNFVTSTMPDPSTTTGMPVTANAFQSTTDGKDFYFMVLTP